MEYYYNYETGRLRIRTPFLHHNEQNAATFTSNVKACKGVFSIETNPLTGSALILFDEHLLNRNQLIEFLEREDYFKLAEAKTSDQKIEETTAKVLDVAEKIIVDAVEGGAE